MPNYREINHRTMMETLKLCEEDQELNEAVKDSLSRQKIYWDHGIEPFSSKGTKGPEKMMVTNKRTLEAAREYAGKKVAILNFANNHSVGGSPFSAGAQEETLCRCTTLYPCLNALKEEFYEKHSKDFHEGKMDYFGNDDIIFTPGVIVLRDDTQSEPPLLPNNERFSVDVISSAAPDIRRQHPATTRLMETFTSRIKKILDIAEEQGTEVLILGAFGCGAFGNPPSLVAPIFKELLSNYRFKVVEFAIKGHGDVDPNYQVFKEILEG